MLRNVLRVSLVCCFVSAAALAQEHPVNAFEKEAYGYLKSMLLRSAEKMPEENYGFKPTDAVRSFGQILGHVADSQYYFCSAVLGEKNPGLKIEKTRTTKADLVAGLKDAFAYCDKAYDSVTVETAQQTVRIFAGRDMRKLDVLQTNNMHTIEHYGNLVTYLRLKNIVPPSSEPGTAPQPAK